MVQIRLREIFIGQTRLKKGGGNSSNNTKVNKIPTIIKTK